MAKRVTEIKAQEMKRLIYQVNKRMYRLEKSGADKFNTTYENALAIIQRGESKEDKKRLSIPKNENALKRQYMKALEIVGGGSYEELTTSHIKKQVEKQKREEREREEREREERGELDKREQTFHDDYGIDKIDYATYNLLKSRKFKQLADALGSDVALKTMAKAINAGLGTSQLKQVIHDFMKVSESSDGYYQDKLQEIVDKYAERYS